MIPEDEGSQSRRRDNIHPAVAIQIHCHRIGACPGTIIDEVGNKLRTTGSLYIPDRRAPEERRRPTVKSRIHYAKRQLKQILEGVKYGAAIG